MSGATNRTAAVTDRDLFYEGERLQSANCPPEPKIAEATLDLSKVVFNTEAHPIRRTW